METAQEGQQGSAKGRNPELVQVAQEGYRRGTQIEKNRVNFIFTQGGIGDYIYWTQAIRWAIETHPWIFGQIYCHNLFGELMKHWLGDLQDRYELIVSDEIEPIVHANGKLDQDDPERAFWRFPFAGESFNACGAHLFNVGVSYFGNTEAHKIPEKYRANPRIHGDEADVSEFDLPETFAVVTTEATCKTRMLPARVLNKIVKHIQGKGITPVFLGKSYLWKTYESSSPEGLRTNGVLDLRNKTSLLEAAVILSKAKFVAGLDNGMLHLAGCSSVPLIMAFTNVDPRDRIPLRKEGRTYVITPPEGLECRFCTSRMRYVPNHNANFCIYGDYLCLEKGLEAKTFNETIDKVLREEG